MDYQKFLSIIAGICPSKQDIHAISVSWRTSGNYKYTQLIVLTISIFLCTYLINLYNLFFIDGLLTYFILTMMLYYAVKYSGLTLIYLFNRIRYRRVKTKKVKYKNLERERQKTKRKNKGPYSPRTQW